MLSIRELLIIFCALTCYICSCFFIHVRWESMSFQSVASCRYIILRSSRHAISLCCPKWCRWLPLGWFSFLFFVSLLTRLWTGAHGSGSYHFINESISYYASAYELFQCLEEVDGASCDKEERWLYFTFDTGSDHDVRTGLVERRMKSTNGNLAKWRSLPSLQLSWIVPAQRHVTFNAARVLLSFE